MVATVAATKRGYARPVLVEFAIHEGGFQLASVFLGQFLPAAAAALGRYLGRGPGSNVHVILSTRRRTRLGSRLGRTSYCH